MGVTLFSVVQFGKNVNVWGGGKSELRQVAFNLDGALRMFPDHVNEPSAGFVKHNLIPTGKVNNGTWKFGKTIRIFQRKPR